MKALLISPGNMPADILLGKKRITIREGKRDFVQGDTIMIGCHIANWSVLADVTSVRHCKLSEVTVTEYVDDGFSCIPHLIKSLSKFYPNITVDSIVTIIRWNNVRGGILGNV